MRQRNLNMENKPKKKIPVAITIKTERRGVSTSLFDGLISAMLGEDEPEEGALSPEAEMMMGITPAAEADGGYFVKGQGASEPENSGFTLITHSSMSEPPCS